jgi:two-component system chemotaxis sensor kinase CheA
VVPLVSLLERAPADLATRGGALQAFVLVRGERRLAVAVEALLDVEELSVEPMEATGLDPAISLGAGLQDDLPVIVLDPDGLFDRWLQDAGRLAAAGLGSGPAREPERVRHRTVMVVDDSITTRTLEKSILEAQGYRVVLAVDGVDALHALRAGQTLVDLVVADIEMPRMDGFALLQAIKADASLSALPVILMTSRNDPADIQRGMELGAEAYITKQKFDQRELLATIGRIL